MHYFEVGRMRTYIIVVIAVPKLPFHDDSVWKARHDIRHEDSIVL